MHATPSESIKNWDHESVVTGQSLPLSFAVAVKFWNGSRDPGHAFFRDDEKSEG